MFQIWHPRKGKENLTQETYFFDEYGLDYYEKPADEIQMLKVNK